jgi:hypothetical protein
LASRRAGFFENWHSVKTAKEYYKVFQSSCFVVDLESLLAAAIPPTTLGLSSSFPVTCSFHEDDLRHLTTGAGSSSTDLEVLNAARWAEARTRYWSNREPTIYKRHNSEFTVMENREAR